MAHLEATLLGTVQFTLDGKPITGFESDKARALLAYLLVEKSHPQRREKLAGLCWPDRPEAVALANLRRVLVNLRQVLTDNQSLSGSQALSGRQVPPDGESTPPFLLITRQAVQVNPQAAVTVDVHSFANLPGPAASLHDLETTAGLYHGDFLAGFSLDGCPECEAWITQQREHCHRLASALHQRLADWYEQAGDSANALRHTRRLIELDPWQEEAHLQAMRLLARAGQREAALVQYEACRRILAEELGVTPDERLRQLYEKIRLEDLAPQAEPALPNKQAPNFLKAAVEPPKPVFAARRLELDCLHQSLANAVDGKGQVVCVIGEAGAGKTALLTEFSRQAMETHADLLSAWGNCHACFGVGDAYHPFRAMLNMLAGDVEQRWVSGGISTAHARRLWHAFPEVARALAARDPQVLPILFDRGALDSHLALIPPEGAPWLADLRSALAAPPAGTSDLQQRNIFEQLTRILHDIAACHPLLLILDDLHWADAASLSMLFHLGRALRGARLLLVCAYRPEEPALEAGMLPKILGEFKQLSGDAWINLDQSSEASRRSFVDAFLDTEANRLGEAFRSALFTHTEGHPLFTIELLRDLEGRGCLARDSHGAWQETRELDWSIIPARVEGAIEERINRLDSGDYELLCAASVEGEEFTAQVTAQVAQVSEQTALRKLSRELGRRGRWVRPLDEFQGQGSMLTRYRFNHQLYQQFVYQSLSRGEQRDLHGRVAAALERLYPPDHEAVIPRLAYHYQQAGLAEKSLEYMIRAGRLAKGRYASQEALRYFSEALLHLPDGPQRFDVLADRADIYDLLAQRPEQLADIQAMLALAEALQDQSRKCDALLALAFYHMVTEFGRANTTAQQALEIAIQLGQRAQEGQARMLIGNIAFGIDNYPCCQDETEQAIACFEAAGLPGETAKAMRLHALTMAKRNPTLAAQLAERALHIIRQQKDPRQEALALRQLAIVYAKQNRIQEALLLHQESLALCRRVGDLNQEANTLNALGATYHALREMEQCERHYRQALACADEIGTVALQEFVTNNLFWALQTQGDYQAGLDLLNSRLHVKAQFNPRYLKSLLLNHLGQPAAALQIAQDFLAESVGAWVQNQALMTGSLGLAQAMSGDYTQAEQVLQAALERVVALNLEYAQAWLSLCLAQCALHLGDREVMRRMLPLAQQAVELYTRFESPCYALVTQARLELMLGEFESACQSLDRAEGLQQALLPDSEEYFYVKAGVLAAQGKDQEAHEAWQKAYDRVMRIAGNLQDEALRRGWLENVPLNRLILKGKYQGIE